MATVKYLFWNDYETTGVNHDLDWLMEIGSIITTAEPPFDVIETFEAVILPEDPCWQDRMDHIVLDMHTTNGLIADVERRGRPIREVEQDLINLLAKIGRPHSFMFSGSAVAHFDRRFLIKHMPGLNRWVQPPNFDVGDLRRAFKYAGRPDLIAYGHTFVDGEKPHRGLADIRDHLNEWRQYASLIAEIPKDIVP